MSLLETLKNQIFEENKQRMQELAQAQVEVARQNLEAARSMVAEKETALATIESEVNALFAPEQEVVVEVTEAAQG